jgi:hypothetical protein
VLIESGAGKYFQIDTYELVLNAPVVEMSDARMQFGSGGQISLNGENQNRAYTDADHDKLLATSLVDDKIDAIEDMNETVFLNFAAPFATITPYNGTTVFNMMNLNMIAPYVTASVWSAGTKRIQITYECEFTTNASSVDFVTTILSVLDQGDTVKGSTKKHGFYPWGNNNEFQKFFYDGSLIVTMQDGDYIQFTTQYDFVTSSSGGTGFDTRIQIHEL